MISVILEGALDGELDDELGYSKYDYKNKDTNNSRNGYRKKTMHTSYGDMELDIPDTVIANMSHISSKNIRIHLLRI